MGARFVQLMRGRRVLGLAAVVALGGATGLILANRASTSESPPPAPAPPDWSPAPNARIVFHRPGHAPSPGWAFKTFKNREGATCAVEVIPGEGEGESCYPPGTLFTKGPLHPLVGSRQKKGDFTRWENAWIWGFADAPITRVELVLRDCTARDLPVDRDGVFADVEGPDTLHAGAWPYKLLARDQTGTIVTTKEIPFGPPETVQARAQGVTARPVPSRCA